MSISSKLVLQGQRGLRQFLGEAGDCGLLLTVHALITLLIMH